MVDRFSRGVASFVVGYALVLSNALASPCDSLLNEDALNTCLANELSKADKELNAVYAKFRERLNGKNREQLKASEMAWIKSRDSDCGFEAESVSGGSAYRSVYLSCMLDRTKGRTKQLIDWAKEFPMR